MSTITLTYDGRSSVMQHLIDAMLAAGATMHTDGATHHKTVTPALRSKIRKAREESDNGETIVCSTPEEMQQYFDSL